MDYSVQISEILNSDLDKDQKEALLNELANKMLEVQKEKEAAMPVFDREDEEHNKELQQKNKELIEKNREQAKATRRNLEQMEFTSHLEEMIGILENLKSPTSAEYYIYTRRELERMATADIYNIMEMYEKNYPELLEKAREEYYKKKTVDSNQQKTVAEMTKDEMEQVLKADENNENDLAKLEPIAQRLGVSVSELLEIAKRKRDKMQMAQEKDNLEKKDLEKDDPEKDDPEKDNPEKDNPEMQQEVIVPISASEIIYELQKGLGIKANDSKKLSFLQIREVKVLDSFSQQVHTGNIKYNIVSVPKALIGMVAIKAKKIASKTVKKEDEERLNELVRRADNLSEEKLDALWDIYKGNVIHDFRKSEVMNMVLENRIKKYVLGKVDRINQECKAIYDVLINDYKMLTGINDNLKNSDITQEQRDTLLMDKKQIITGKAELISHLRELKKQANSYLSDGIQGLKEDIRALTIGKGKNYLGYKDAVKHDENDELAKQQANLEHQLLEGIAYNDDEKTLNAFFDFELLFAENAKTEKRIYGMVSSGEREYSPFAEALDYNKDTFYKDLLSSIAMGSMVATTAIAIYTHAIKIPEILNECKEKMKESEERIHQIGEDIIDKRSVIKKGMEQENSWHLVAKKELEERMAAQGKNGESWDLTSNHYLKADYESHKYCQEMGETFNKLVNDMKSRGLNEIDTMKGITEFGDKVRHDAVQGISDNMEALSKYMDNHPQYELGSFYESLEKIVGNPNAITEAHNDMITVLEYGEELANFNIKTLESLPSDMAATILDNIIGMTAIANYMKPIEKCKSRFLQKKQEEQDFINKIKKVKEKNQQEGKELKEEQNRSK